MMHPLDSLRDGVTGFVDGSPRPVPLRATAIAVQSLAGLAIMRVRRVFKNDEADPIEAVMTFPVPFEAVLTGLSLEIDGRKLAAAASPRESARPTYEAALDRGKTAVLHEEALQGLHILSVGQLGPGKEAVVEIEFVAPMAPSRTGARLAIPMTVGQMYGRSPLLPADDILVSGDVHHPATIVASGSMTTLAGVRLSADPMPVRLDRAIELVFPETSFGTVVGRSADGRAVSLRLRPVDGDDALDAVVLFDTSGSMNAPVSPGLPNTKWDAARSGLQEALSSLRPSDHIALRCFNASSQLVGRGRGPQSRGDLVASLPRPGGGTELGKAVMDAASDGREILVITDGQTFATEAQRVGELGKRVSAVLVGSEALGAMMGHLVKLTGGQLFVADPEDMAGTIAAAVASLRVPARGTQGSTAAGKPLNATCIRGGVEIAATWDAAASNGPCPDTVGRFAAALAIPLLPVADATELAVTHGLCTHLTSLIVVDEAGEAQQDVPTMRKVALQGASGVLCAPSAEFLDAPSPNLSIAPAAFSKALRTSWGSDHDRAAPQERRAMARAFLEKLNPATVHNTPGAVAAGIAWATHAAELARGDLSSITPRQQAEITRVAALPEVEALAKSLGADPAAVALALLARLAPTDRAAARIARKILGRAESDLIEMAAHAITASIPA